MIKIFSNKWIGWLMFASQLMITVFAIQWLSTQYESYKELLKKELLQVITKAEQQVIDSILVKTFINPLIKNGIGINTAISMKEIDSNQIVLHTYDANLLLQDASIAKSLNGNHLKSNNNFKKIIINPNSNDSSSLKNNILMHGVKLIVNEIAAVPNSDNVIVKTFKTSTDTNLFKNIILQHIQNIGINASLLWVNKNNEKQIKKTSFLYFNSPILSKSFGIQINHYYLYLLKNNATQLLFAVILILLTGMAFWFAFRNMKYQQHFYVLRNDFISNISHELKTPVSTVKVAIDVLNNFNLKNDKELAKEYLQIASLEMSRLELLIDKVMNTSILENDKQLISKKTTDLKILIIELLDSLQLWLSHSNAKITINAPDDFYIISIDTLHIEGVIKNLLDNSIKYGVEEPKIHLSLLQNDSEIIVTLTDNGPGIPKEYADKVFDKFFRIPTGNQHNVKGYGLGLSYAALVMQQHDGKIEVKNNSESGCTFILYLPKTKLI